MIPFGRFAPIGLVAILLLSTVGCGTTPTAALPKTYPLSIVDWHHGDVDRVDFVQKFSLADYQKVVVEPVKTAHVKLPNADDNTYQPVVTALSKSTNLLIIGIQNELKESIHVEPTNGTPPGKSLIIRAEITEMIPGSQAARYWVGYGTGRAETFLKGEIVDAATHQTLLKFENAKASSGGIVGGSYNSVLQDELEELGNSLGILLSAYLPPKS